MLFWSKFWTKKSGAEVDSFDPRNVYREQKLQIVWVAQAGLCQIAYILLAHLSACEFLPDILTEYLVWQTSFA